MLTKNNPETSPEPQPPGTAAQKLHGPRYYRGVWAAVLEQFYGDDSAARTWMTSHCPSLGGIPVDLAAHPGGRDKLLAELQRMNARRAATKPHTAWHLCGAFYPSKYNGELLFRGTLIPASSLFSELSRGGNINKFLGDNPGVTRDQIAEIFELIILDLCDF